MTAESRLSHLLEESPAGVDDLGTGGAGSRSLAVLRRDPAAWIGGGLAVAIIAVSILAPVIAPHDPTHQYRDLMPDDGSLLGPSELFPLGTDRNGRDYLSRLLHAGLPTLAVGLLANLGAVTLGVIVGLVAGYVGTPRLRLFRGRTVGMPVESTLMRTTDVGLAFPALLLAIALTAVFGKSLELVALVIAAVLWTTTARLVYGRVLVIREADFVLAAHALGCRTGRVLRRHLLPHLWPIVLVCLSLGIASTILFEATLSFLGAGAPEDTPTWGKMLAQGIRYVGSDLRMPLLPAFAIFLTVLAFTLLGDALRDATDPHGWDAR
jgi:peptide/nickel transport system permease protein